MSEPRITIHPATDAENPRDWYHYSVMVCHHNHVGLPNECEHPVVPRDFDSWDEMKTYLIKVHKAAVILPVYMYDHGSRILSTAPFSCKWDSGQVGWIYATRSTILEVAGIKCLTAKAKLRATADMTREVAQYSQYFDGELYDLCLELPDDNGVIKEEWAGAFYDFDNMKEAVPVKYHPLLERAIREYRGT